MLDKIGPVLLRDNAQLLGRLILSVRTTETIRDLRFLDEKLTPHLSKDQREQYASECASPEIISWMRLITWLVPRLDSMPATIDGELFPLLDAWVTAIPAMFAREAHVPTIAAWALQRLGNRDSSNEREAGWGSQRDSTERARSLLLKSAAGAPAVVRDYLAIISDRAIKRVRKQIIDASGGLAAALPVETAAFIERACVVKHDRKRDLRHHTMDERSETLAACRT